MSHTIARKPNQLIQAGQSLTPLQSKALFGMLAQFKFNVTKDNSEARLDALSKIEYEIPLSTLLPNLKSYKGGNVYKQARVQIEKMMAVTIRFEEDNELHSYNLVSHSVIKKNSSIVTAKFNRDIIPVLVDMVKSGYTEVELTNILPLKSSYSIRIYELLLKNKNMKHIVKNGYTLSIKELRFLLGIDEKQYKLFSDFKKRIIVPTFKEINSSKTNLRYKYELIKKGRTYTDIRFFDIYLVSSIVDEEGKVNSNIDQIDLFDSSPLSIIHPDSAMEIRDKHTPQYIEFYYKKALDVEKQGKLKTSLAGLYFSMLNTDEDKFYEKAKKEAATKLKKEKFLKEKAAKELKQGNMFKQEERATEIILKDALSLFEALPQSERVDLIKRYKEEKPFLTDSFLIEHIALKEFSVK